MERETLPTTRRTIMTEYLLSVWHTAEETVPSAEEMEKAYGRVDAFNAEVKAAGQWVFGGGLHSPDTATVVDATGGKVTTTDGPFAETKEQIGGFWVLTAPDLDAALELAQRASAACGGPVEVRPFQGE